MKKPVLVILGVVILAGLGATAWLLMSGPTKAGGVDAGVADQPSVATDGGAAANLRGERRSTNAAPARATAGAPEGVKKLPPPPVSGESTVVGRVVDAVTHAAIPKAALVLRHPEGEYAVTGESRGDGAFTLEGVPGVVGARIFVNASGYGPKVLRDVHVPPHDKIDLGAIELARGSPIRGRVIAALGAPISGAEVNLLESKTSDPDAAQDLVQIFRELRRDDESLDAVITAADGTFAFAGAAPGSYVLAARKSGWQVRFSTPVAIVPGAAIPFVDLRLTEAKLLRGIVKNEAGDPIAGAGVAALEIMQEETLIPKSQKMVTGADGRFAYSTFGSGQVAIVVGAAGYSGASQSNLVAGAKEVEFVLKKATRIEGRVFDRASNKGLPGAVVVAFRLDTEAALEETRSGPDGAYVIEHGPAGKNVTVFAKHPGYTMASLADEMSAHPPTGNEPINGSELLKPDQFASGTTVHRDLAMVAGGSLTGRVVDDRTNQGIAGSEITIRYATQDFFGFSDPVKTRSGADGVFTVASMGAGRVMLSASAEGYLMLSDAQPDPEEPSQTSSNLGIAADIPPGVPVAGVIIRLRRGADVDVIVTNPEGAPMGGATVSWVKPSEELAGVFGPVKHSRAAVCDGAGKVRLQGVAEVPGIVFAARHPDYPAGGHVRLDPAPPPARPITIVLARSASIAGTLLDPEGKPIPDRELSYRPDQNEAGRAFGEWSWAGRTVVTDAAGKFLIENLPPGPGKISLAFAMPVSNRDQPVGDPDDVCFDPAQESVTLTAGMREQITLQLVHTLSISGTVFDAAGKPMSHAAIVVSGSIQSWGVPFAQSGEDGSYRVTGLPPGEFRVDVSAATPPAAGGERESLTRTVRSGSTRADFHFTK